MAVTQKQDRQAARTVSEIERNYGKRFTTLLGLIEDSRDHVDSVESGLKNDILQTSTKLARTSEMIEAEAKRVTALGEDVANFKISYDGIETRVSNAEGQASEALQTAQGFETRVNDANNNASIALQTAQGFETRVNDANNNASIALQTAQGFETRVGDVEVGLSEVKQKATEISLSVESVDKKVDNLQIGGRNYFTNAKRLKADNMGNDSFDLYNAECPNGFYVVGNENFDGAVRFDNVVTENGEWTLSWEMRGSRSTEVGFWVNICGKGAESFKTNSDNSWTSCSLTVNVTNYTADFYHYILFSDIAQGSIYVRNIKLEKGNIATEWTPAPEDTTELRKDMTELKVTAKGVDMVSENSKGKLVSFIGNGDNGGEWSAKYYNSSGTYKSGLYFDFDEAKFVFDGKIEATSGTIGGFYISSLYLSSGGKGGYASTTSGVYIGSDGLGLGAGAFYVRSKDGFAHMGAGEIGNWTISNGDLAYETSDSHGNTYTTSLTTSELMFYGGIASIGTSGASFIEVGPTTGSIYAQRQMKLDYTGLTFDFPNYATTATFDKHFIVGYSNKTYINFAASFGATNKWTGTNATLAGTWRSTSSIAVTSDARKKHDVIDMDDRYAALFDLVRPVAYRYNDGTSDRYHTGFIANEVEEALGKAGISTQEFAGFVTVNETNDEGESQLTRCLRYEEFIAVLWHKVKQLEKKLEAQYAVN